MKPLCIFFQIVCGIAAMMTWKKIRRLLQNVKKIKRVRVKLWNKQHILERQVSRNSSGKVGRESFVAPVAAATSQIFYVKTQGFLKKKSVFLTCLYWITEEVNCEIYNHTAITIYIRRKDICSYVCRQVVQIYVQYAAYIIFTRQMKSFNCLFKFYSTHVTYSEISSSV